MPYSEGVPSRPTVHSAIESQGPGLDRARGEVPQGTLGWVGVGRPGEEGPWEPGWYVLVQGQHRVRTDVSPVLGPRWSLVPAGAPSLIMAE